MSWRRVLGKMAALGVRAYFNSDAARGRWVLQQGYAWAPGTGENTAGGCAAYNGTDGRGAGCYCNGTDGRDAAYPGAAYFNEHTTGRGASYSMVWPGDAPRITMWPVTGEDMAGYRDVYNSTAGPGTGELGAAPCTTRWRAE